MDKIKLFRNALLLLSIGYYASPLQAIFTVPFYKEHAHLQQVQEEGPWFTGPLLAPSPNVVQIGHTNFEPYIFVTKNSHNYNSHWHAEHVPTFVIATLQAPFWVGLSERWDVQITPQGSWNHSKGPAKFVFNDFPVALDYQLVPYAHDKWYPPIKLTVQETFPTGKYQHLDPHKNGTDIGGAGSFSTLFGVTTGKVFHVHHHNWYNVRFNFSYNYAAPVHVKGFNTYGGAHHTHGTVYPGNSYSAVLGQEFSLNLNWALALDIRYQHTNKNRFSGHAGRTATGEKASVGGPSSEQFSLAPAIEYNFNADLGLIAGAWFAVAGRNSPDFTSYVIAFNWFH